MRWQCQERFPHQILQGNLLVSDPGMHHGTCVTHVPWCMSGSPTRGVGENHQGIPGACATRNFTYLARGPCHTVCSFMVMFTVTGIKLGPFLSTELAKPILDLSNASTMHKTIQSIGMTWQAPWRGINSALMTLCEGNPCNGSTIRTLYIFIFWPNDTVEQTRVFVIQDAIQLCYITVIISFYLFWYWCYINQHYVPLE